MLPRQPHSIAREERIAYVQEVITLLEMESYADAIIGMPGEGLNVEQRKRLTIGVEMAAKPALLLFLDEPTSGLDSQTDGPFAAYCASSQIVAKLFSVRSTNFSYSLSRI